MEVSVRIFYPEPPAYAEAAPDRAVYIGDADGRCEVFAWDVARGTRRQLTDRPRGTVACAIEPSGARVWWFDDGPSGVGVWRVQPFEGGEAEPSGLPAGRPAGLAMALDGTAAVGLGHDDGTTSVHLVAPDRPVRTATRIAGYAQLVDISPDASLLAIGGGPEAADAVTVLDLATGVSTVLSGSENALWAAGFGGAGIAGTSGGSDPRQLLLTQRTGDGYRLALWTRDQGLTPLDWCAFDTEISPSWYPDGRRVLVRRDRHARSTLHVVDLAARTVEDIRTEPGGILAAAVQPDGDLHHVWTDSRHSPRLRTASGRRPPEAEPEAPVSARVRDHWTPTPAGSVHTLVTMPGPPAPGPRPAVFLLHGGPFDAARDAYDPLVSVFAGIGCVVVRPNHRGSVGYGAGWRDDFTDGVGLTQLADIAAVHAALARDGVIDPGRTAVAGHSWGGYLALLAAGVQPGLWRAAAAVNPVADYPAAFRETTDAVRALDVRLFGGTPDERPEEYRRSSPATYAAAVCAPILVVAGIDDPRCPPGQIESYIRALRAAGLDPALEWTPSGHDGFDAGVHARMIAAVVGFVGTALGGRPAPAGAATG